jgi:hypothetical protein
VVASEDRAELVAVGFGPKDREHVIEQRLSFPRTPIL